MGRAIDLFVTYRFIKLLVTPFNKTEAFKLGISCERGSHRFFKRYGERFEDSEGKRIFLEFADEERVHLELLIREYRDYLARQAKSSKGKSKRSVRVRN